MSLEYREQGGNWVIRSVLYNEGTGKGRVIGYCGEEFRFQCKSNGKPFKVSRTGEAGSGL